MTGPAEVRAEAMVQRLAPGLAGTPRAGWFAPFLVPYVELHNAIQVLGLGRGCQHVCDEVAGHRNTSDGVWHIAAWRPGVVVCGPCAARGGLDLAGGGMERENWLCDRCLQHRPGQVSASVQRVGRYLVWFGVCRPCRQVLLTEGQTGILKSLGGEVGQP